MAASVRAQVAEVLARDACTGCGLCPQLDRGLAMHWTVDGYLRPAELAAPDEVEDARRLFNRACPGVSVAAQAARGTTRNDLLGSSAGVWEAWASDETVRHVGSSGGALTALNTWLIESGRATRVVGAAADRGAPRRSVSVTITTRDAAIRAAGSRYTPVAALSNPDLFLPGTAVTAKPCEAAALRALSEARGDDAPIILSFFCAGTPSAHATDRVLAGLGLDPDAEVEELWYRGHGWPGAFTAVSGGTAHETDYERSWGETLGPATQWRCKVCPDGVGESADVVAADSWVTDARGYPVFTEAQGVSALIARTERGRQLVLDAVADGVIGVRDLSLDHLEAAQPLQVSRRRFLLARMIGSTLAGRPTPRYTGFALTRLGVVRPRQFIRVLRGTFARVRAARTNAARAGVDGG